MKSLVKCGLLMAVIGTALMFAAPQRAEARRYYSYYPAYPAYGPVYTAYYPRRAAYPRPRPRRGLARRARLPRPAGRALRRGPAERNSCPSALVLI